MRVARTRPKLTVTADGTGVVVHAGTRLLADATWRVLADTGEPRLAAPRAARARPRELAWAQATPS